MAEDTADADPFDFENLYAKENDALQAFLSEHGALALYHLGGSLNWDFCDRTILWVVQNPDCPKATASRIFWQSGAEFRATNPGESYGRANEIMDTVLRRWKVGEYRHEDWADPEPDMTRYEIDYYRNSEGVHAAGNPLGIPDDLFIVVEGTIPPRPAVLHPGQNAELDAILLDLGMFYRD